MFGAGSHAANAVLIVAHPTVEIDEADRLTPN
jgi:hypothetical protein